MVLTLCDKASHSSLVAVLLRATYASARWRCMQPEQATSYGICHFAPVLATQDGLRHLFHHRLAPHGAETGRPSAQFVASISSRSAVVARSHRDIFPYISMFSIHTTSILSSTAICICRKHRSPYYDARCLHPHMCALGAAARHISTVETLSKLVLIWLLHCRHVPGA